MNDSITSENLTFETKMKPENKIFRIILMSIY